VNYKKDAVYRLYNFGFFDYQVTCTDGGQHEYTYRQELVEAGGEGYLTLDSKVFSPLYDMYYPRAGVLQTPVKSNIIAQMAVVQVRDLHGQDVGPMFGKGYVMPPVEKFDSIPSLPCHCQGNPMLAR